MDLFNRQNLLIRRSHQAAICTFEDAENSSSVAEVFIRNHNGLHFLRQSFPTALPASTDLYYETYRRGLYSPRPYHLQLIGDASVFYCVVALAVSCCKAWNLDAAQLIRSADPRARVTDTDLLELKEFARWQNTVFPGTWNTPTIEALSFALGDIDCGALGAAIKAHTVLTRGY